MTIDLLIRAIVHQTTILVAQLATLGGGRAPLAQVANQVFLDLVRELERQGVSRKVSADMFGLGLRTYRRKVQRLSESSTDRGRSLWEAVLDYVKDTGPISRDAVLLRFALDDEAQVKAVLRDLCESQLLRALPGSPPNYRAASEEELVASRTNQSEDGLDDLLIALLYREGPLTLAEIARRAQAEEDLLEPPIARLVDAGRLHTTTNDDGALTYEARALVVPLGAPIGWEAAIFDHYKAVVTTILARLNRSGEVPSEGGSTYTIDVWPGHPLEAEVRGTLSRIRQELGDLRRRVGERSRDLSRPTHVQRAVVYAGQRIIDDELE